MFKDIKMRTPRTKSQAVVMLPYLVALFLGGFRLSPAWPCWLTRCPVLPCPAVVLGASFLQLKLFPTLHVPLRPVPPIPSTTDVFFFLLCSQFDGRQERSDGPLIKTRAGRTFGFFFVSSISIIPIHTLSNARPCATTRPICCVSQHPAPSSSALRPLLTRLVIPIVHAVILLLLTQSTWYVSSPPLTSPPLPHHGTSYPNPY
jgi:hypothetical protein